MPVMNNESSQKCEGDGNETLKNGSEENPSRPYDLWKSDSLFPCWNGLIPENITVPHPSELPLPSLALSSPIHKMLETDTFFRNEVEATSTTDENMGQSLNIIDSKMDLNADYTGKSKYF